MRADRPRIKPGLRQVWRDPATVQIGLTPDVGVIVTGLEPGEAALLEQLDGTHRVPDVTAWASAHGLEPARVARLVDLLAEAGVLTGPPTDRAHLHALGDDGRQRFGPDALAWSVVYPDVGDGFELLADRGRQPVLVVGRSRLATAVTAAIGGTGVTVARAASLDDVTDLEDSTVDPAYRLVVLVGVDAVGLLAGQFLLGAQLPHLAVIGGADRASVGPLVVPGRSACLRCVDLHRTDRDPAWPTVAAQLGAARPGSRGERGESSLTGLVAALAGLQVACWVDQRRTPASVGATLTVRLPDGLSSRHPWTRHPRCGCAWLPGSLPGSLAGSLAGELAGELARELPGGSADPAGQATMDPWPTSPAAR